MVYMLCSCVGSCPFGRGIDFGRFDFLVRCQDSAATATIAGVPQSFFLNAIEVPVVCVIKLRKNTYVYSTRLV